MELADDVRVCTDADIDVTDADIANVVEGVLMLTWRAWMLMPQLKQKRTELSSEWPIVALFLYSFILSIR